LEFSASVGLIHKEPRHYSKLGPDSHTT